MSEASCKPDPHPHTSEPSHIDQRAESLTDLIDVLQRQSFTRRFEPRVNQSGAERELPETSPSPHLPNRPSR